MTTATAEAAGRVPSPLTHSITKVTALSTAIRPLSPELWPSFTVTETGSLSRQVTCLVSHSKYAGGLGHGLGTVSEVLGSSTAQAACHTWRPMVATWLLSAGGNGPSRSQDRGQECRLANPLKPELPNRVPPPGPQLDCAGAPGPPCASYPYPSPPA